MTGDPAAPQAGSRLPPVEGVLVVDKPEGLTSHDVVAAARRALGVRQIGHTGTLDPMATGVLALVVGRATRLAQFLSASDKEYLARIRLGVATDTCDRTGRVVRQAEASRPLPGIEAVAEALRAHLGEQAQVPPAFSAKKVEGVRAYALARRGQAADLEPAIVSLHAATIEAFEPPLADVRLTCSAGFYVRTLADSLGRRLGCGACLEALRRTASGAFTLAQAVPLAEVETLAAARLVPLERALPGLPAVRLTPEGVRRTLHGNDVGPGHYEEGRRREAEGGTTEHAGERREAGGTTEHGGGRREAEGERTAEPGLRPPPSAYMQLLSPDGRLLAIARPVGSGVLHPAVVLG